MRWQEHKLNCHVDRHAGVCMHANTHMHTPVSRHTYTSNAHACVPPCVCTCACVRASARVHIYACTMVVGVI